MDRRAPARRPSGRPVGFQQWRLLLFVHWTFPPHQVRSLVPTPLELDLFAGEAYVSLVAFAMAGVRPAWLPEPCGLRFLETNARTYVHHRGVPGVYFFSLDASSRLAVRAARLRWGLPYHHARMRLQQAETRITYHTDRVGSDARLAVIYQHLGPLGVTAPESIDYFLLERYILYVARGGRLFAGQVHHTPYPAHTAQIISIEETLLTAAGLPAATGPPAQVHYSPGVDVEIFPLRPAEQG